MLKENKGITLVALVVTIIVLLILAGVTISLVLSQNGIFTKAQEAKSATNVAEVKQAIQLSVLNVKVDTFKNNGTEVPLADITAITNKVVDDLTATGYKAEDISATPASGTITIGEITATITTDYSVTFNK